MATLIYINAVQGVVTKSNKSQWCLPQSAPYDVHVNNNQRTAGEKSLPRRLWLPLRLDRCDTVVVSTAML